MLAYTFVGMYIRWQGLPTIATNIGPPRNMMIQQYQDTEDNKSKF